MFRILFYNFRLYKDLTYYFYENYEKGVEITLVHVWITVKALDCQGRKE